MQSMHQQGANCPPATPFQFRRRKVEGVSQLARQLAHPLPLRAFEIFPVAICREACPSVPDLGMHQAAALAMVPFWTISAPGHLTDTGHKVKKR